MRRNEKAQCTGYAFFPDLKSTSQSEGTTELHSIEILGPNEGAEPITQQEFLEFVKPLFQQI